MTTPTVSFLVPTFGRPPAHLHLLEECLYWALDQTYAADLVEVVVLNDAPGQVLDCDHPRVRVVNAAARYPTLGDKRNALIDLARGEVLVVQDDDDVALPGRATQADRELRDLDYWEPPGQWYEEHGRLTPDAKNCKHHASAYRKSAGLRYRSTTGDEGQWFGRDAAAAGARVGTTVTDLAWSWGGRGWVIHAPDDPCHYEYVYRWGVSPHHLSGYADTDRGYASRHAEAGRWAVVPRRRDDYAARTAALLQRAAAGLEKPYDPV